MEDEGLGQRLDGALLIRVRCANFVMELRRSGRVVRGGGDYKEREKNVERFANTEEEERNLAINNGYMHYGNRSIAMHPARKRRSHAT